MSANVFTARAIEVIRLIPRGRVATYGGVAAMAGNGRAARQVVRVLHTYSRKEGLPWHRVVNREGCISLARGRGYEEQMELLLREGIEFGPGGRIDLEVFLWKPAHKRQIDFDETSL